MSRALRKRYGLAGIDHLAEKKLWVKWMRARDKRDWYMRSGGPVYQKWYARADELQYQLQDMSPYGHQLVWSSEGRRFEDAWLKKHGRSKSKTRSPAAPQPSERKNLGRRW